VRMSEVVDPELIIGVNALAASRALAGSASGAVNSIASSLGSRNSFAAWPRAPS
jgi:hypothetical protein